MLEVKNLSCSYNGLEVVHDVSFNVKCGEILNIVGPNGCGKSTILKGITNIIEHKGEILLNGEEIKTFKRKELAKKTGLMSQSTEIFFEYTVYETVALGRYPYMEGMFSELKENDRKIIMNAIEMVGLLEEKDRLITELSGGQLQKVYLAKVFAQEPDIIILDEPTNHLDLKAQIEILSSISSWAKEKNKIVIGVLHDLNLVQMFSDRVILIGKGKIKREGIQVDVLKSKEIEEVYDINIRNYMIEALKRWE